MYSLYDSDSFAHILSVRGILDHFNQKPKPATRQMVIGACLTLLHLNKSEVNAILDSMVKHQILAERDGYIFYLNQNVLESMLEETLELAMAERPLPKDTGIVQLVTPLTEVQVQEKTVYLKAA